MTETSTSNQSPTADDPRYALAQVTYGVRMLMEATSESALGDTTPCPEFSVRHLMEHLVMVMRRVAAVGLGRHWTEVQHEPIPTDLAGAFQSAAHEVMDAWTDPAKLDQIWEVPFGTVPGAALMAAYTAEFATHGWDLAQATAQDFSVDDDLLIGALEAARMVPAEGREDPGIPFGPVVDPGTDAPVLLQIAGWFGRKVA